MTPKELAQLLRGIAEDLEGASGDAGPVLALATRLLINQLPPQWKAVATLPEILQIPLTALNPTTAKVAIALAQGHTGTKSICNATGLSQPTVTRSLRALSDLLKWRSCSSSSGDDKTKNCPQVVVTTTTTDKSQNFDFVIDDEDDEDDEQEPDPPEVDQLARLGCPRHIARAACAAARNKGMTPEEIRSAISAWSDYAATQPTIHSPAIFVASRLRDAQDPPNQDKHTTTFQQAAELYRKTYLS